jgi:hypothetical protein
MGAESSAAGVRRNFGGPESSESRDVAGWADGVDGVGVEEAERRRGAIVAELSGSLEALTGLSPLLVELLEALSELDAALRNFGRSLSSLLLDDPVDEFAVSPELDAALCNRGRSGSSSLVELLAEVLASSLELELARRSLGRSLDVGVPDELLAELVEAKLGEEGFVIGWIGSSVACDAAACSSIVPSFTIAIV